LEEKMHADSRNDSSAQAPTTDQSVADDKERKPKRLTRHRSFTLSSTMPAKEINQAAMRHPNHLQHDSTPAAPTEPAHSSKQDHIVLQVLRTFLQSCPFPYFSSHATPLQQTDGSQAEIDRAIKVLDGIPCSETHKIGVVIVKQGQTKAGEVLRNYATARYSRFLDRLGWMLRLRGTNQYVGGLDMEADADGEFTYIWRTAISSIAFHVVILMPSKPDDDKCIRKLLHISNDHVTIVFNESGAPFNRAMLAGAVNFVYIVVTPFDDSNYLVTVDLKEGVEDVVSSHEPRILSHEAVGLFVRQLALHANLNSLIRRNVSSNWMERRKQIQKIGQRFGKASLHAEVGVTGDDRGKGSALQRKELLRKMREDFSIFLE
jgi:hypothetical protein